MVVGPELHGVLARPQGANVVGAVELELVGLPAEVVLGVAEGGPGVLRHAAGLAGDRTAHATGDRQGEVEGARGRGDGEGRVVAELVARPRRTTQEVALLARLLVAADHELELRLAGDPVELGEVVLAGAVAVGRGDHLGVLGVGRGVQDVDLVADAEVAELVADRAADVDAVRGRGGLERQDRVDAGDGLAGRDGDDVRVGRGVEGDVVPVLAVVLTDLVVERDLVGAGGDALDRVDAVGVGVVAAVVAARLDAGERLGVVVGDATGDRAARGQGDDADVGAGSRGTDRVGRVLGGLVVVPLGGELVAAVGVVAAEDQLHRRRRRTDAEGAVAVGGVAADRVAGGGVVRPDGRAAHGTAVGGADDAGHAGRALDRPGREGLRGTGDGDDVGRRLVGLVAVPLGRVVRRREEPQLVAAVLERDVEGAAVDDVVADVGTGGAVDRHRALDVVAGGVDRAAADHDGGVGRSGGHRSQRCRGERSRCHDRSEARTRPHRPSLHLVPPRYSSSLHGAARPADDTASPHRHVPRRGAMGLRTSTS